MSGLHCFLLSCLGLGLGRLWLGQDIAKHHPDQRLLLVSFSAPLIRIAPAGRRPHRGSCPFRARVLTELLGRSCQRLRRLVRVVVVQPVQDLEGAICVLHQRRAAARDTDRSARSGQT
jgi:hypothetical protein